MKSVFNFQNKPIKPRRNASIRKSNKGWCPRSSSEYHLGLDAKLHDLVIDINLETKEGMVDAKFAELDRVVVETALETERCP